jgi:hypothetical protein
MGLASYQEGPGLPGDIIKTVGRNRKASLPVTPKGWGIHFIASADPGGWGTRRPRYRRVGLQLS